ncbi:hypothetical protein PG988_010493 [Apiospora saccharicola]
MRLSLATTVPLLGYAIADGLSASEARPRGLFTAAPPRQTGSLPMTRRSRVQASSSSSDHRPEGKNTQDQQQVPFVFCPEDFGSPPKECDACGGDSLRHGVCNNLLISGPQSDWCLSDGIGCSGYYCQCTHEGREHNPLVALTTVVDGQTGTVTYEPVTLSKYAQLRASTTVTLTEVATSTQSGGSIAETVLAVVFPGGLAWLAMSESGGAAAIVALRPPNDPPQESKEDDETCKPEPECKDCGGSMNLVQLCRSGNKEGCPCDEKQNCPHDPMKCSDQTCGGDDGQGQCNGSGETKGCHCCPDQEPDCTAQECGGSLDAVCSLDKLKQCRCYLVMSGDTSPPQRDPQDPSPAEVTSIAQDVFTAIWHADPQSVPGWRNPKPTKTSGSSSPWSCTVTTNTDTTFFPTLNCYCDCGGGQLAGLKWATAGTRTSSFCQTATVAIPLGFTPITESYCTGAPQTTTTTEPPPKPSRKPPPPEDFGCTKPDDCDPFGCDENNTRPSCKGDVDSANQFCVCDQ